MIICLLKSNTFIFTKIVLKYISTLFKMEIKMNKPKVLLGMSGGVDSSVSALLLKQNGYDVIGTTLELFTGSSCCNISTYIDAKAVCQTLGIPHFTFDYKGEFKKYVIGERPCMMHEIFSATLGLYWMKLEIIWDAASITVLST